MLNWSEKNPTEKSKKFVINLNVVWISIIFFLVIWSKEVSTVLTWDSEKINSQILASKIFRNLWTESNQSISPDKQEVI